MIVYPYDPGIAPGLFLAINKKRALEATAWKLVVTWMEELLLG